MSKFFTIFAAEMCAYMKRNKKKRGRTLRFRSDFGVLLLAAIIIETTAAVQYFYSRAAIKAEAEQRARTELRAAELEVNVLTTEMEAAVKMLSSMAARNLEQPRAMYTCTRILLKTLEDVESASISFIPDYYPEEGHWFEPCSSREIRPGRRDPTIKERVTTRQIGGEEHDYLSMEWYENGLSIDSTWWSEPYYDDAGAKKMVVSVSYPVKDRAHNVVAVALVDLSLERLNKVSEHLQVYEDSYYSIQSCTGLDIVARPDTKSNRKYLKYDEVVDATGWKLSIIIPEDVLFADLRKTGAIVSLLMLVGLGLLIFILFHSARDIQKIITLNTHQERMRGELEIAQTIQRAMLPKVFPPFLDRLDLNIYGIVDPAKEIGGDLYDFYIRHEKLFFCVGDVSGKGVPASLLMATTRSLFRSVTAHEERAAEIMGHMNTALADQNEQFMFVTLFLGVLDLKSGTLEYCNAGHNAPVVTANGDRRMVDVLPNLPLGIEPGFVFQSQTTRLNHGDTLFLYTDGLTEAENKKHELYGEERMLEALKRTNGMPPRDMIDAMQNSVAEFVNGAQQSDDLTMLAIRYQIPAIVMRNDIQQIPTLAEWLDGLGIPDELNMPINLALEEAVSNVMLYAYPGRKDGKVFVEYMRCLTKDGERMVFTISDSGIPFDPTATPEVDITLSAEERAIGGLGIHLVKQLMDDIHYERKDDKNILMLVKKL